MGVGQGFVGGLSVFVRICRGLLGVRGVFVGGSLGGSLGVRRGCMAGWAWVVDAFIMWVEDKCLSTLNLCTT